MEKEITISDNRKKFEDIKKINENKIEYWMGRELMPLLGYLKWENFEEVIGRAAQSCMKSGQSVDNHFLIVRKMVKIGSNTIREIKDYNLDRYACYLIAQNGDPKKSEIALAQAYFAIQTRRQEIFDKLTEGARRLFIRRQVVDENKQLFSTARMVGVRKFGLFNYAGYKGLYGKSLTDVERQKGIGKGELLDRAGSTELAANLFRITQTDEKLKKDNTQTEGDAIKTHQMVGGRVRQTIQNIGGEMPENLPAEKHLKEIKKEVKKLETSKIKELDNSKD